MTTENVKVSQKSKKLSRKEAQKVSKALQENVDRCEIRIATAEDFPKYYEHILRFDEEAVKDEIIAVPYDLPLVRDFDETRAKRLKAWSEPLSELTWKRSFLLWDKAQDCVGGELQLYLDPPIPSSSHRAYISMGLERKYRGKGHGSRMMETAIQWAQTQDKLDWLDLYVFEKNTPARKLYEKYGFVEVGRIQDRLRVRGEKLTDIAMALKL